MRHKPAPQPWLNRGPHRRSGLTRSCWARHLLSPLRDGDDLATAALAGATNLAFYPQRRSDSVGGNVERFADVHLPVDHIADRRLSAKERQNEFPKIRINLAASPRQIGHGGRPFRLDLTTKTQSVDTLSATLLPFRSCYSSRSIVPLAPIDQHQALALAPVGKATPRDRAGGAPPAASPRLNTGSIAYNDRPTHQVNEARVLRGSAHPCPNVPSPCTASRTSREQPRRDRPTLAFEPKGNALADLRVVRNGPLRHLRRCVRYGPQADIGAISVTTALAPFAAVVGCTQTCAQRRQATFLPGAVFRQTHVCIPTQRKYRTCPAQDRMT